MPMRGSGFGGRGDAEGFAAVDGEGGTSDHKRGIAREIIDGFGDFFGGDHAVVGADERAGGDEALTCGGGIGMGKEVAFDHLGPFDGTGANCIDADFVDGVTETQASGEGDDGPFTDGIDRIVGAGENAGVAGKVDDGTTVSAAHPADGVFAGEKDPFEVSVETAVPVFLSDGVNLFDHADAGGVDEDVEATIGLARVVDESREIGFSANVTGEDFDTEGKEFGVLAFGEVEISDDNFGSASGKEDSRRTSDSVGTAGDDGDATVEGGHLVGLRERCNLV